MVFLLVAIVDGEADLARQRLERRDGPVALLGVGRREQRVDRGIGAAVALGVEEVGERAVALIPLGREMDVSGARLLAVADDQDELRQGGSPVLAATLCHARGRYQTRRRGDAADGGAAVGAGCNSPFRLGLNAGGTHARERPNDGSPQGVAHGGASGAFRRP
jgi:hypothetical protein